MAASRASLPTAMTTQTTPSRWKTELAVALLNGANIVCAFASQVVIYGTIGPGRNTDAYFASSAIPQLAISIIATTAAGALLPRLATPDLRAAHRLAITSLLAAVFATFLLSLPFFGTTTLWVPALFPGFGGEQRQLCQDLVSVQLFTLPLIAANATLGAWQQARGRFAALEGLNLAMTLCVIAGLLALLPVHGIVAAAWVSLARFAAQFLILLAALVREQPAGGRQLDTRADLRSVWRAARPLLSGNLYFKTDVLVDRHLLSMSAAGSLSLFSLAQTVQGALSSVIGQALGSTAVPRLAAAFRDGNAAQFRNDYRRSLFYITLMSTACLIVVLLALEAAQGLVPRLTSQRFSTEAVSDMWFMLLALGGIPIFGSIGTLVSGAYYATGDTSTPTVVSAVTFTAFIALKLIVFSTSSIYAFCVLTSLYYLANALILAVLLNRQLSKTRITDDSR